MDIRESLFYALANAKCPILSMRADKKSLEDIFLDMTKMPDTSNGEAVLENPKDKLQVKEG